MDANSEQCHGLNHGGKKRVLTTQAQAWSGAKVKLELAGNTARPGGRLQRVVRRRGYFGLAGRELVTDSTTGRRKLVVPDW